MPGKEGMKFTARMERGAAIERRVRDCVALMSRGNEEAGRKRFVEHALWCAERKGMRLWKNNSIDMKDAALDSLKTLFGEKLRQGGIRSTNENWILDIWEVAVNDYFDIENVQRTSLKETSTLERLLAERKAQIQDPIDIRLLEAYINRNDDVMFMLIEEVGSISEQAKGKK